MNLKDKVISIIPQLESHWHEIQDLFKIKIIPEKTILLEDGDVSKYLYMIYEGCLRTYLIKEDGTEITAQFFFENQMVASMESAFSGQPGRMYLESIEESKIIIITLQNFKRLFLKYPDLGVALISMLQQRLIYYNELYTSFILNTPEERYEKLINNNPEIINRIPHYYIASYLGITPVSLSRIRTRLAKKTSN